MAAEILAYFSFGYFILVNGTYQVLMVVAFYAIRRHMLSSGVVRDKIFSRQGLLLKPVSILAPAFNEELTVVENIRSLLSLNYPNFEVILINDGSSDNTLQVLIETFDLLEVERASPNRIKTKFINGIYQSIRHPGLIVLDKENGGKADALNAGINFSRNPLIMVIDTDSLLEKDVLLQMVRPFVENPETIAVGGVIRVINGCEVKGGRVMSIGKPAWLPSFQITEYLRAFLFGRMGWAAVGMLTVISGAFGMFRKQEVIEVGGYSHTVGEDIELVIRLHKHMMNQKKPYRMDFIPEPICWTEVPESMGVLGRQRNRWNRGLMDTARLHPDLIFNPRYGRIGMIGFPFLFFVEGLGPIMEIGGLFWILGNWYLGNLNGAFLLAVVMVAIGMGIVVSLSALVLEELTFKRRPPLGLLVRLFIVGIIENFGYRQINAWWRFMGIVDFLKGKKGWGAITRKGFAGKK